MATITVSLNKDLLELMNKEMKEKHYENRSEFIRTLMREYFYTQKQKNQGSIQVEPVFANDQDAKHLKEVGKGKYTKLEDINL